MFIIIWQIGKKLWTNLSEIYSLWHVNTTLYFILANKICSSFQNKFHINHSFLTLEVWQWYALRNSDTKLLCVYKIVPKGPSPTSTASVSHSVAQSCLTLCNPVDCSMPGFSVHYQLPEPTQIHVHCVNDAIQPSHPVSSPSLPALNLS